MKAFHKILIPINVLLALALTTIVMANITGDEVFQKDNTAPKGTQVEVYTSNGKLLTTQTLYKKDLSIDFCDARLGIYTVRVTKGENTNEYHYIKK
jgi:hypothetical protein